MKRLNLFLILCFLSVQMFASQHVAEFGFKKHEHHGQVCSLYLHHEHANSIAPDAVVISSAAEAAYQPVVSQKAPAVVAVLYHVSSPRAPPFLS